jgi:hypothetical protein
VDIDEIFKRCTVSKGAEIMDELGCQFSRIVWTNRRRMGRQADAQMRIERMPSR